METWLSDGSFLTLIPVSTGIKNPTIKQHKQNLNYNSHGGFCNCQTLLPSEITEGFYVPEVRSFKY